MASQMSCMSPYSMPLSTILTKCPLPSSPTQSQHGSSPDLAQIAWKIGLIAGQAAGLPPGIREGPYLAPSSPPDTPDPTKRIPFSLKAVALLQQGNQLVDEGVHCGSRLDEDHHPPWSLQLPHHLLQRVSTNHICALR